MPPKKFLDLAARVKKLREERGLTQKQVAEHMELGEKKWRTYQRIENGMNTDVQLSTLARLARGFSVEMWELLAPDAVIKAHKSASSSCPPRICQNAQQHGE